MSPVKAQFLPTCTQHCPTTGVRVGMSAAELKQAFFDNLFCRLGRMPLNATLSDAYTALALTVCDRVMAQAVRTMESYAATDARAVAYLSAEFLPGPHLANNMLNLGIVEAVREAMAEIGV
ncbi:glycogen phosphorylase, partial [bacterium]|nr:glycogen phosphorylase [bacterium]